jgi:signal transduction histidine kinase/CheY-like chemotaxis protein
MAQRPNNQVYRTVVLIWISLSAASVLLSALTWYELRNKLKSSAEALAIRDVADAVLQAVLEAQNGERGFSLTGIEIFLAPFQEAEGKLPVLFARLAELARHDPALLNRVLDLRGQVEVLVDRHHKIVATRRDSGRAPAAELIQTGEGEMLMDALRGRVAEIRALRDEGVSAEGGESRQQLLRAGLTSLGTGILGLGAGFFALHLARVTAKHQQREGELLQAKVQAEHENQEKSYFLANLSHEIRTPMNAILGFGELLAKSLHEPKHREYLSSIRASAASLLQLINDILDMSKVEAGVLELHPEPTDPREICDFVLTVFGEAAVRKGVRVVCRVAEEVPRALLLDRTRLRQVVVNLVGNAVKFTDQGRVDIEVTAEKEEDLSRITLRLSVEDTGVGIPPAMLESIFEPFVQSGANREMEQRGTGLGLAIVKRLVQRMGGTITVTSVVGRGSAFHLRFPEVPLSVRLPLAVAADPDGLVDFNQLKPARILVVDDNEANCRLVAGMFEGSHHQLAFGTDGREAVDKTRTFQPDLLLLDIRLPILDGREALAEIRRIPGMELLPVIAVTASTSPDDGKESLPMFNGYLRKPFTMRELLREIAQVLPGADPEAGPEALPPLPPAGGQRVAESWPQAARQLRQLETDTYPAIRDSLAINETRAFAGKLQALGRESRCEPLLTYAEALGHYAETYAVDAMERHLGQFPALIERLERKPAHGP